MAFLSPHTNSFKDQEVRAELTPLALLAQELRVAIVVIRHLNKGTSGPSLYRGSGSIGIIGTARSGLMLARHPDDEARRVLSSQKSNLGPDSVASLEYSIGANERGDPYVVWHGVSRYSAQSLVMAASQSSTRRQSAMDEACAFLQDFLAAGRRPEREVEEEAHEVGISTITLRRASKQLQVRKTKVGAVGTSGQWLWELPSAEDTHASHEDAQHHGDEHLRVAPGAGDASALDPHEDVQLAPHEHLQREDERLRWHTTTLWNTKPAPAAPSFPRGAPKLPADSAGEYGML
jgi:hypothetical protein